MRWMWLAFALLIVLTLSAYPAGAVTIITPTDLDTVDDKGDLFVGPLSDDFTVAAPPPDTMGVIVNNVYLLSQVAMEKGTSEPGAEGIYTYTHTVTPSIDNISEFNTAFAVAGFTGVAGWSFSEGNTAAGNNSPGGMLFEIWLEDDGTLDWNLNTNYGGAWGSGETITFFFQSTLPPATGDYNLINAEVGTATSLAPVPEPATVLLLGAGLLGLAVARRMRVRH